MKWTDVVQAWGSVAAGIGGLGSFVFAWRLWQVTRRQAEISSRQADIAEAISQADRPLLYPVLITHSLDQALRTADITDDEVAGLNVPLEVNFCFENFGKQLAILTDAPTIDMEIEPAPRQGFPPFTSRYDGARAIAPGERTSLQSYTVAADGKLPRQTHLDLMCGNLKIWLHGKVTYADPLGRHRQLLFCWRYDASRFGFEPYPPDRNHTVELKPEPSRATP